MVMVTIDLGPSHSPMVQLAQKEVVSVISPGEYVFPVSNAVPPSAWSYQVTVPSQPSAVRVSSHTSQAAWSVNSGASGVRSISISIGLPGKSLSSDCAELPEVLVRTNRVLRFTQASSGKNAEMFTAPSAHWLIEY